ncbi:MAG: SDR family oxidoreductase [Bdellovibrionota bacterium]
MSKLHAGLDTGLKGRTALVCGASSGIGAAAARILAEQGARVVALARREEPLKKLIDQLPGSGHQFLVCDLSYREELRAKITALVKEIGPIEILICNSSGPKAGPIVDATEESFLNTFGQHLLASQTLVQVLLPGMKERGYGRIVNVISTSVKIPIANLGVSNTIRGAVASWAKTLSLEVAASGITVNSVLPGYTETERLAELLKNAAAAQNRPESDIASDWKNATPMKRFAKPHEVAAAIGFFASPAASYITGVAMPVDGGRTGSI